MNSPLLLTPGPISTHHEVRAAMDQDLGSRDPAFVALTARVRAALVALIPEPEAFTAVPVQGSGTFAVEAMLGTLVPPGGEALVVVHSVCGARAAEILERAGRRVLRWMSPEEEALDLGQANKCLEGVPGPAFALLRRSALVAAEGRAHSVSLDLFAQWSRLEQDGQLRMTQPTHVPLALDVALRRHAEEGGVEGRGRRQ